MMHMTEKHRDIGPVLIDLDFRFKPPDDDAPLERRYDVAHVCRILQMYYEKLSEYVNLELLDTRAFVMEKPAPRIEKNRVKDGIHIVMPGIVTTPIVQLMVREKLLHQLGDVFKDIGIENTVADCFDEAVIQRNNWQMYGSCKPDNPSYDVTHIFSYAPGGACAAQSLLEDKEDYIELLSIRNKHSEAEFVGDAKRFEAEEWSKKANARRSPVPVPSALNNMYLDESTNNNNVVRNQSKDLVLVQKLVDVLNASRADSYDSWIRVGWCLRNIDYRLLDKWVEFSKQSSKFVDGECEQRWDKMRVNGGLGIATLKMLASADNPEAYKDIVRDDVFNLIHRAYNGSHYDVACVVYALYGNQFVCASVKNHFWYEFNSHRWQPCEDGMKLSQRMSEHVCHEFLHVASVFNQRAAVSTDDAQQRQYVEVSQKLSKVALNLKNTMFKRNVLQECSALFYVSKFQEKLDSKLNLIGFENGVYDLDTMNFREGQPDDYITFNTGINYAPLNAGCLEHQQLVKYFSQVFPIEAVRQYVLTHLASCLNGDIREERFHIWTGSGCNSKSILVSLVEKCFGDYACKLPVSLLTNKRAASNAASSEIARTKGRRFAVLQEPSENERFNVGLMKELSGGDKIMARQLFHEPFEFQPMFKMILTCNDLPEVPATDDGTWRRIRLVEFQARFTDKPDPSNPNHFPMDHDLPKNMGRWRETFMGMLIEQYKRYRETGLVEPEEVMRCTLEYQKNNDYISDFLESCTSPLENAFVSINELYNVFKVWARESNPDARLQNRKDFAVMVRRCWGIEQRGRGGTKGWYGHQASYDPYGDENADDAV